MRLPPLRPYQLRALTDAARDQVIISAPQLGKTVVARLWLLVRMLRFADSSRPRWWTSPTYAQARHGLSGLVDYARQWDVLDSYTTTTPLTCRLKNGSFVNALSWDNPQGMYGPTVLEGVSDEFGWMTAAAYSAISSRRAATVLEGFGHWLWIGNVGTIGGEAQKLWDTASAGGEGFSSNRWTWRDMAAAQSCGCGNGKPVPDTLEAADRHKCKRGEYLRFIRSEKSRMSAAQFAQLYDAEWADFNELPVYDFERGLHVDADRAEFQPDLPILLSCDFNVDPMCWTLAQTRGRDQSWTFDEIVIPGGATTIAACEEFKRRYPNPKTEVRVYGDRSGKSRDTKSKITDYQQIQQSLGGHYYNFTLEVPSANPPVSSRVQAVNALLRSADGTISWWVHPRCSRLIQDRAQVSFLPGTRDIDKRNKNRTHASDADDYRWVAMYPIQSRQPVYVGTASASAPLNDPFIGQRF